eukprot:7891730-Lingulodinium_polyedra.AAC.1
MTNDWPLSGQRAAIKNTLNGNWMANEKPTHGQRVANAWPLNCFDGTGIDIEWPPSGHLMTFEWPSNDH